MNYKLTNEGVQRLDDGAFIPNFIRNRDWQAFLEWQAQGNIPQPKDPDPLPIDFSNFDNNDKGVKAMALVMAQLNGTPLAQIKALFKQKWDSLP